MSDVIAQLPEKAFDSISDHLLCVICTAPTDQWARACHAQHSFCAPCLIAHEEARMAADGEAKCPTCRGELVKNINGNFHPDRTKNDMTLDTDAECPQKCGESFKIGKLKAHMQKDCPNGIVPCPMAKLGCEHVMKRCEVQQHLKDDNHTQYAMGFMMQMADAFKTEIGSLKTTITDQTAKIESQAATISNLNTALASHTTTVTTNTTAISGFRTKLDTVEKKLNEALSDGEHSLKQIAIQTKKRASPGQGTGERAVRQRTQVQRQNDELQQLRDKVKDTDQADTDQAATEGATDAAPAATGISDAAAASE